MSYSLYVFDSDYMIDKIVALDNCTLLCSKIPRKTPKVFFTADLDKDCECDILVVKVSKRNAETFNRGDLKLRKKLAKVVIVTNTPLVSLDAYLAFGLCCSLVYMKGKEVIYSVNNFSELPEEDMSPIEVSSSPEEDNGCDLDGDKDVHIPGTVDLRLQKRSAPKGPWSSKSKAMNGGMCISPDPLQEEDFRQEIKEEVTIFSYSQGFQNVNNTVNKFLNSQEVYRRFNFLDLPSSAPTQIWEEEVPRKVSSVSDCKSRVFRHGKLAELLESDEVEEEPKTEDFDLSSSKSSSYEFGEHFSVHVDDSLFKVRKHKGMKQENPSAKKRKKGNDYRQQDETA